MCRKTLSASKHPPIYFRWGKLRYGFHGIWATFCVIATIACMISTEYVWVAIAANQVLAMDAYSLLDQVPHSTVIVKNWIVAPHKEAFKRTMAVMHYTSLRLCRPWLPLPLYIPLLAFCWSLFLPFNCDLSNGNTYFFPIPMFLGVSVDIMAHLWSAEDYLTTQYLLAIQFSALCLAFAFTLAFRGIVPIKPIYFGSAAVVGGLLVGVAYYLCTSVDLPSSIGILLS